MRFKVAWNLALFVCAFLLGSLLLLRREYAGCLVLWGASFGVAFLAIFLQYDENVRRGSK
jgi:hypothetical protein